MACSLACWDRDPSGFKWKGPSCATVYLNGYCPGLLVALQCNMDTKFIMNGEETCDGTWYCTGYQSKRQGQLYNVSGLLAMGFMFYKKHQQETSTLLDDNWLFVYRCFNSLNQWNELSGPQVMSYLMGWGMYSDCITIHLFIVVS